MLNVLRNPTYARLYSAQIVALLGTGLLTVALGLIAWDIAGENAGQVLGLALTIKMIAYVFFGPITQALLVSVPRKTVLIAADLFRALVALALPFVSEVWQIYILVFLLQLASATFSPVFQAVIPSIFKKEGDYTRALSLSRLAYDLESLLSPALAALLLTVMTYTSLFIGTCFGFVISAILVWNAKLPHSPSAQAQSFRERVLRGSRIYLATPRLRGLLCLNMAISATGSIVIVNTVIIVRSVYGLDEGALAVALGAAGAGSMIAALVLPRVLDKIADRFIMIAAGFGSAVVMSLLGAFVVSAAWPAWGVFLGIWAAVGFLQAVIMTPSGRLLQRSSSDADRPALFAAQFALSHACWLIAYPLAGFLGAAFGVGIVMLVMGAIAIASVMAAQLLWPAGATRDPEHSHTDLPEDHPHLQGAVKTDAGWVHRHPYVIDDEHKTWPVKG
ncbi:MFS transporter [Halocynthiibacter sp.]|uniref:MFS transporter n=1 Tax=Halocynthiibacter sp. TaxID=1979210 RepID=UPI003C529C2D